MTAALEIHERLEQVKKEKQEAVEDFEDQQETTEQTAVMLDRWQSYADELQKQVRQLGGQALRWEAFREGKKA